MPSESVAPELAVLLELPPALAVRTMDPEAAETVRGLLTAEVDSLLERLGIPGRPRVTIRDVAGTAGPSLAFRPLHLTVGGQRCRLPAEDVQRIIGYVQGRPAVPRTELLGLLDLADVPPEGLDPERRERWHEFLRLACRQAICRRPSVLLGPSQLAAYAAALSPPDREHGGGRLGTVLSRALAQRISLADTGRVAAALDFAREGDADLAAETLISQLRSEAVELQAPRAFLAELSRAWEADPAGSPFNRLRDALRDESGLRYPRVQLVPDDTLRPRSLRVKVNDLEGVPWVGLEPDECLVSAEPAKLASAGVAARPAINPATGVGASLAPLDAKERLEEQGWTTWTVEEHVLLCVTSALRTYAPCFVHVESVADTMAILADEHPELVAAVGDRIPPGRLTRRVRELIGEGTPLIDPAQVLYLLLEYADHDQCDDHVRARLQRSLLRRWAFGFERDLIVGFHATGAFEQQLLDARSGERDETTLDRLLEVLQEEMDFLPGGSGMPLVLTSPDARRAVREEIHREFPRIGVMSAKELAPTADVVLYGDLRPRPR